MRHHRAGDGGATVRGLLLVVGAIAVVIAAVVTVGAVFARVQASAGDRRIAEKRQAALGQSMLGPLADASDIRVGLAGHALVARVPIGSEAFECRAWAIDDDGIRYLETGDPVDLTQSATWDLLVPGVRGALVDGAAFREFAGVVRVSAGVEVGDVVIPFYVISSPPGSENAAQC